MSKAKNTYQNMFQLLRVLINWWILEHCLSSYCFSVFFGRVLVIDSIFLLILKFCQLYLWNEVVLALLYFYCFHFVFYFHILSKLSSTVRLKVALITWWSIFFMSTVVIIVLNVHYMKSSTKYNWQNFKINRKIKSITKYALWKNTEKQ